MGGNLQEDLWADGDLKCWGPFVMPSDEQRLEVDVGIDDTTRSGSEIVACRDFRVQRLFG